MPFDLVVVVCSFCDIVCCIASAHIAKCAIVCDVPYCCCG